MCVFLFLLRYIMLTRTENWCKTSKAEEMCDCILLTQRRNQPQATVCNVPPSIKKAMHATQNTEHNKYHRMHSSFLPSHNSQGSHKNNSNEQMNIPLILDIKGSKNVLFYLVINQSKFTAVYKVNCILKQTQVEG